MRISSLMARLEKSGPLIQNNQVDDNTDKNVCTNVTQDLLADPPSTHKDFINQDDRKAQDSTNLELQWLQEQQLVSSRSAPRLPAVSTNVDCARGIEHNEAEHLYKYHHPSVRSTCSPLYSPFSDLHLKRSDDTLADTTCSEFDDCIIVCDVQAGNESPVFKACWYCAPFTRKSS